MNNCYINEFISKIYQQDAENFMRLLINLEDNKIIIYKTIYILFKKLDNALEKI